MQKDHAAKVDIVENIGTIKKKTYALKKNTLGTCEQDPVLQGSHLWNEDSPQKRVWLKNASWMGSQFPQTEPEWRRPTEWFPNS